MENIILIVKSCCNNQDMAQENQYMPPLGVLSIANTLRMHGYHVDVLDFSEHNYEIEDIVELIENRKPIYIGFSVYTENVDSVLNICRYLKKRYKDIPLVLGGPHPTLDTQYCMRKRYVDFILKGDGEHNSLELAEAIRTKQRLISYKDIQGLIYIDEEGKYDEGLEKRYITNLDLLPIINRDYLKRSFTAFLPTVFSSRGCPGQCIYCASPMMSGGKYRMREIENVFLETIYLQEVCENYQEVFFCDDTFTVFKDRIERFIELCDESEISVNWRCESRVDAMYRNSHLLKGMKRVGCKRIQFGIESGNQEVLDKIRKGMKLPEVYEIIDLTIKEGINVAASYIFGHYCDTRETMEDTVNMIERLKTQYGNKVEIAFGSNTPFPGTYQYEHMEELGIIMIVDAFSQLDMMNPVMRTNNFSVDDLKLFLSRASKVYSRVEK